MKTLGSLKVSERTIDNIHKAVEIYNKNTLMPLTIAEFRRLSYELLSQLIIQNKEIPIRLR